MKTRISRSTVSSRETTAEETGLVERGLVGDGNDRVLVHDRVLREGRATHEVEQVLALAVEPTRAVGHDSLALGRPDRAAQVGLARFAELALAAFGRVELFWKQRETAVPVSLSSLCEMGN